MPLRSLTAGWLLFFTLIGFISDDARAAPAKQVVLYYGDSLAREAQTYFVQAFAGRKDVQIVPAAFPGTAPCDWYSRMTTYNKRYPGALVVSSFYGNLLTRCVLKAQKGSWQKTYFAQLDGAMQKMNTAKRVWMALPPIARPTGQARQNQNWQNLQELGRRYPSLQPFDAGSSVENPDGTYTQVLECLLGEICTGQPLPGKNQVRSPDGLHFCPGKHSFSYLKCSQWDSGAWRYGRALAQPVLDYLG